MTLITAVRGHRRWDSRGRPTVEVTVRAGSATGRALAPAGASTGSGEAVDLRDHGFGGYDVTSAVASVNGDIAAALTGVEVTDQAAVDARLEEADGTAGFARLGGNAAVATSMAVAHAAAASRDLPLWRYLNPDATRLPLPEIQIFGGGAHAGGRVDLQDFLVVPFAAGSLREALDWAAEIYRHAGPLRGEPAGVADEGGWWPVFDGNAAVLDALVAAVEAAGLTPDQVGIAIDVAAGQFGAAGSYRLCRDGRAYDTAGWCEVLLGWLERYPIVSIEDPFAEDDADGMAMLTAAVGDRVQIVGDDFLVTDAARVRAAAGARTANTVLIKPNQAGTLTRARAALDAAAEVGFGAIVSARSGETEDVTIAHLAVGWGGGGFKVGSMARGERTAKWNELLRIEEDLGAGARYAWEMT